MDTNQVIANATVALAIVGGLAFLSNVAIAGFTLKAARSTRRSAEATEKAAEATRLAAEATRLTAEATGKAAEATRDEADATREEAAATRQMIAEVQTDRALDWRPYLVSARTNGNLVLVGLQNIGRGPALRLIYCERVQSDLPFWLMSTRRRALGAGVSANIEIREMVNPPPKYLSSDIQIMCNDQFGNWLKFDPAKGEPEVCQPHGPKPEWVDWFEGLI